MLIVVQHGLKQNLTVTGTERQPRWLREAGMGSYKRPHAFDPLDLEIIDRVYEATWAQVEARYPVAKESKTKRARRRFGGGSSLLPQAVLSSSTHSAIW